MRAMRSASSRLGGTSTRTSSAPASIATRASSSASTIAGETSAAPSHGRRRVAEDVEQLPARGAVGVDPVERGAGEPRGVRDATARRSDSARSSASSPRSTLPAATSSASSCGARSYSAIAIANGSAIPPASRRGSGAR